MFLPTLLGIKWQGSLSGKEVFKKAKLPSMESIWLHWLIVALGWPCHENDVICIPNAVFFSELQEGRYCDCDASGRNCCKDQLKRQLVLVEITYESLQQTETIVARH